MQPIWEISSHQENMKNKKEEILTAAEEEFARHGYEGANICRIAKKVCVTHVLLYYHFKNKENLFASVLQRKIDGFVQSVLPAEGTDNLHFLQNIDNLIVQNFDFIAHNVAFARLIVNESQSIPSLADIAHTQYADYIQRLQNALDREAAAGNIAKSNAEQIILYIFSLNIMSIIVMPEIEHLLPTSNEDINILLQQRKQENIDYIHLLMGVKHNNE